MTTQTCCSSPSNHKLTCKVCGLSFTYIPKSNHPTYKRQTCSPECERVLKQSLQMAVYKTITNPQKDTPIAHEKIAQGVLQVIQKLRVRNRNPTTLHRNVIDAKILSAFPHFGEYDERFRKKCITLAILNAGYHVKEKTTYDVTFSRVLTDHSKK